MFAQGTPPHTHCAKAVLNAWESFGHTWKFQSLVVFVSVVFLGYVQSVEAVILGALEFALNIRIQVWRRSGVNVLE